MDEKHNIADYLQYIGASLPAKGFGWRKMKCPFHEDHHASAGINFETNRFKCHGCGVAGDVYDLIMYKEGGNYNEALKFAEAISSASNSGVRKTYSSGPRLSGRSRSNRGPSEPFSFRSRG